MAELKIEYIELDKIIPYSQNTRTHSPEQVDQIAESIRLFGFTKPVLIDADNTLIAGHGACLAARIAGLDSVPCVRLTHLSERERRAYIIADNKIALNSGWDFDKLSEEVSYLMSVEFDIDDLGFNEQELAALLQDDKDLLPKGKLDIDTTIVSSHERRVNAGEEKVKAFEWRVIVEATSKANAKKILKELTDLGHTCVMLKDGAD